MRWVEVQFAGIGGAQESLATVLDGRQIKSEGEFVAYAEAARASTGK